jgi:hypothetical protein
MGGRATRRIALLLVVALAAAGLPTVLAVVAPSLARKASADVSTSDCPPAIAADHCIDLGTTAVTESGGLQSVGDEEVWGIHVADPVGIYMAPFVVTPSDALHWVLRDDQHRVVFDDDMRNQSFLGSYLPYFLHHGDFTLTVTGNPGYQADKIASYSFTLFAVHGESTPIALDQRVDSTLSAPGAYHRFTFDVPADTWVWPQVTFIPIPRPNWTIRDSAGQVFLQEPMSTGVVKAHAPIFLPAGTNYSVFVEQTVPNAGFWDFVSQLSFRLWTVPPADTFTGPANAPLTLPFSSSVAAPSSGRLEGPYSTDSYQFSVAGPLAKTIDIKFTQPDQFTCVGVSATLVLPNGGRSETLPICDSTDLYAALNPGTYTLIIHSDPGSELNAAQDAIVPKLYSMSVTIAPPGSTPNMVAPTVTLFDGTLPTPAFSIGTSVTGTLATSTAQNLYTFNANAGDRIYFRIDQRVAARLRVIAPGGVVLSDTHFNDWPNPDPGLVILPKTGVYEVVADGATSAPANYGFTTTPIVATPRVKGAVTMSISKDDRHQMSGHVDPGLVDQWTFHGSPGQRIFVSSCRSCLVNWELRAPDGGMLFDFPSPEGREPGALVLPLDGTYTVSVFASYSVTDTTGSSYDYNFEIWNQPAVAAPKPISLDTHIDGEISSAGQVDVYTFTGTPGEQIYVESEIPTGLSSIPQSYLWYQVRGPNGSILRAPDLYGQAVLEMYSNIGHITLPRTGTATAPYTVIVHAYADATHDTPDSALAQYAFKLVSVRNDVFDYTHTSPLHLDVEPGTINGTNPNHGPPDARTAGMIDTPGGTDEYRFTATAGSVMSFSAGTFTSVGTLMDRLIGPQGFPVPGFDSTFLAYPPGAVTLPWTGEYRLIVFHRTGATGSYGLVVNTTSSSGQPMRAAELHTVDVGGSVKRDTVVDASGTENPDPGAGYLDGATDADSYSIDAVSGDAVDIALTSGCWSGTPLSARWNLRDPNGNVVARNNDYYGLLCRDTDMGPMVLPITGRYTLTISAGTQAEEYAFSVNHLSHLQEAPQPGQAVPPPQLTRVDPPSAPAGGFTTISIYGKDVPQPTGVEVRDNGNPLPVASVETHAVYGSVEGVVATAQVDFTNAAAGDVESITVDLPDGSKLTLQPTFPLSAPNPQVAPTDITTSGFGSLRAGSLNRVYVRVGNSNGSDIISKLTLEAPSALGNVAMVRQVKGVTFDAADRATLISAGVSKDLLDSIAAPRTVREPATLNGSNLDVTTPVFTVPAGGSTTVAFEINLTPGANSLAPIRISAVSPAPVASNASAPPVQGDCSPLQKLSAQLDWQYKYLDEGWRDQVKEGVRSYLDNNWPSMSDTLKDDVTNILGAPGIGAWTGGMEVWLSGAQGLADEIIQNPLTAGPAAGTTLGGWIAAGPEVVGGITAGLLAADTAAFESLLFKFLLDLGITSPCDPNALVGPGMPTDPTKPFEGGTIHPNDRAMYTVEFQNVGTAPARRVEVDVDVPQLDASKFSLDEVHFGSLDVTMYKQHRPPDQTQLWNGTATVPINGSTNTLRVSAAFNPNDVQDDSQNLGPHRLRVVFTGPPLSDQFGQIDPSSASSRPTHRPRKGKGSSRTRRHPRPDCKVFTKRLRRSTSTTTG